MGGDTIKQISEKEKALRIKYRDERKNLTLWAHPISTVYHFFAEIIVLVQRSFGWLWRNIFKVSFTLFAIVGSIYTLEQTNPTLAGYLQNESRIAIFWIVLGFLSSFGLGTGLHTFILYLGPFIARVTQAAFHCNTVSFLPPFHPAKEQTWSQIKCGEVDRLDGEVDEMTIAKVIAAVRYPAIMWGLGTAIGELPPYFMAKAARLSGEIPDDEDFEEFHETLTSTSQSLSARMKRFVQNLVEKSGFIGILLCASIPNPLFDLAGITCGHFLVPFATFFSATAIGKAIIKTHLQMYFVVIAMSETGFASLQTFIAQIPSFGAKLAAMLQEHRDKTKRNFTSDEAVEAPTGNIFSTILGFIVFSMIFYFALSIINHVAQSHKSRGDKVKLELELKNK